MNFSSFFDLNFYNFLNFSRSFNKEISVHLLGHYKKSQTILFPLSQISKEGDCLFIIGKVLSILESEIEERDNRSYLFFQDIFSLAFNQKEGASKSLLIKEKLYNILQNEKILSSHKILVIQNLHDELRKINRIPYDKNVLCFFYSFLQLLKSKLESVREGFSKLKLSYISLLELKGILEDIPLEESLYDEWFSLLWELQRSLKELSLLSDENFLDFLKNTLDQEFFNFNINNFYLIPYDNYEDSFKISLKKESENKDIVDIYEAYQIKLKEWF